MLRAVVALMRYWLLVATIAMMATGQILFKTAADGTERWAFLFSPVFIAALALYAATTVVWIFTLRSWPITIAYPAQATAIALVTLISIPLFGERPSPQAWIGILTIIAGLLILIKA